ncbi:MAG TPA: hypothetical protein VGK19_17525 [Capsulimonadaceae bacterium]|jgi:hypothetical protein
MNHQTRIRLSVVLVLAAAALTGALGNVHGAPVPAAPVAPASPAPIRLSLVPAPADGGFVAVFDAGIVSPAGDPEITHRFIVQNESSHALTFARLAPIGVGVSAALDNNVEAPGFELGAGDLVGITVTMKVPTKQLPFSGSIEVLLKGQKEPAAVLRIDGTSSKGYALATRNIHFGSVKVGATMTRPIYLLVSPTLLASGKYPVVVSADPEVRVFAPDEDVDPATIKGLNVPATLGAGARLLVWRATFYPKAVSAERVHQLWLAPADRSVDENADPHISIEARAVATGEITIERGSVDFGDRVRGTDWSEWALLRGSNPSVFADLLFDPGSNYLQLDLVDPAKHVSIAEAQKMGPNVRYLQIILSAVAPLGKLQTTITVTTGSGQTFTLPVTANVVEAKRGK